MANATGNKAQWGKRSQPDTGFDAHGLAPTSSGAALPAFQSAPSAGERLSLDSLSHEICAQLFRWLDARGRASVALCSRQLSAQARLVRRTDAGNLLCGGKMADRASSDLRACDSWIYQHQAKVSTNHGWQNAEIEFREFAPAEHQALEAIGFEAAHRFVHINALRCQLPVLTGITKAAGWQSLSVGWTRRQLQQGLDQLALSIAPCESTKSRELSLRVFDCEEMIRIEFPGKLRAHGLDLVELYLDQLIDPGQLLPSFGNERYLQSLEILIEKSVEDAASAIGAIGNSFPDLRYFRLVSYQPFGIASNLWSAFLLHHPKLQELDLNHLHLGMCGSSLDFSRLNVKNLILSDFHLADPDRKFEQWITDNRQLELLDIELVESTSTGSESAGAQLRDSLLGAIAANTSLTELRLKGSAWMTDEDGDQIADSFLSLLDTLINHPKFQALQIPAFDFRDLSDFLNGASQLNDSLLMEKLCTLESLQPKLRLTLGEFELNPILYKSAISGSDRKSLQALSGWSQVQRQPRAEELLEFSVEMAVWGDGAFRRFMKFCSLPHHRQLRYLIGLAKRGSLVEGSLRIVRTGIRADSEHRDRDLFSN